MRLRTAFDDAARVAAEFTATRFAVGYALGVWGSNGDLTVAAGRSAVTVGQLARAAVTLEVTFSLRRFVQFEAVLRDYWRHGMGRNTRPDMRPLMDRIASDRQMNGDDLASAHATREYRNSVVHGSAPVLATSALSFDDCQRRLARYLRWLPQQW